MTQRCPLTLSLDVASLFTNISLELTVEIIDDSWERIMPHTKIPKDDFIRLLEFIFHSNFFVYNGTFYRQRFGCPMGLSLSSVLADIVMTYLIKTQLNRLSFRPFFIRQYVDDLLMAVPGSVIDELLMVFNDFDDNLKFTIERENNRSIPFLDTIVHRGEDNNIKLDWYRKESSSGRYINSMSYHDISIKANVILGLKKRIEDVTHPTFREAALGRLVSLMLDNGYSTRFVNKLVYNTPCTSGQPTTGRETNANDGRDEMDQTFFAKLPFIREVTFELIKLFKKFSENMKIAKYNLIVTQSFFNSTKDRLSQSLEKNTVYKVKCGSCSLCYIGQTSQALKKRMSLHKSDSTIRPDRCALGQHIRDTGHYVDFEDVTILEKEENNKRRLFLEMYHINRNNTMNSKTDTRNLSNIYSFLLGCDNIG